ncbi:MAG: acyl-[acyl-carrier-protein] thioesterase [Deltaproteobacteria bacterium]
MNNKYFGKGFEVHYYEANEFREASIASIMNYLQDTAISQSQYAGLGVEKLIEKQRAWILTKWNIEIERYPSLGEKIIVNTWPSKFERCFATREFVVKDENENEIIKAASLWIFLDTVRRKPLRIPEEVSNAYLLNPERAMQDRFEEAYDLKKDSYLKDFNIRKSDIDTNEHVNNVKYVEWIIETIPIELYKEYTLNFLDVRYIKELVLDNDIACSTEIISQNELVFICVHTIKSPDGSIEFAKAKTIWHKR